MATLHPDYTSGSLKRTSLQEYGMTGVSIPNVVSI